MLGDRLEGTEPAFADITFESDYTLEVGEMSLEIMHRGSAHTLGDSFVWLDERDVMFTGDIVYVDRLLGIGPTGDTAIWLEVFDAMAAFEPNYVVPGHGAATDMAQAMAETRDYLAYLRSEIGKVLDEGGPSRTESISTSLNSAISTYSNRSPKGTHRTSICRWNGSECGAFRSR